LSFSGGRVSGLTLGGFGEGVWLEEAPNGWTEIPRKNASPIRVFRDAAGALRAVAGRPRFDSEGDLYVVEDGNGIHVEGEDKRSHLPADNVILACGAENSGEDSGPFLDRYATLSRFADLGSAGSRTLYIGQVIERYRGGCGPVGFERRRLCGFTAGLFIW
jgi:hypothetical protein